MVEEELDETLHRLGIIMETEMVKPCRVEALYNECHELFRSIVSPIATTRRKIDSSGISDI